MVIMTALEYLRENGDDSNFSYRCSGSAYIEGGTTIPCFDNTAHGYETLTTAFANSCNSAFSTIGAQLNKAKFRDLCTTFLFNSSLPIEIEYSKSSFNLDADSGISEAQETGIGQGKTMMSPLHNLLIAATVANDGIMMKPTIVGRVEEHTVDEAAVDQIDDARRDGDHPGQTDEVTLPSVLPKDGVEPPGQKAEQVDCHDPGQIRVEQGAVMGPPGGLDSTVCAQQQGEIKAEGYDGSVQRHQQSPAGQYLQQICFLFLHSISSFASGAGIRRCQLPFFISRAYHPIISLVLYSILFPMSSYFTFWTFFLCRLSPAATARSSSPRPSGHAAAKQTAAIPAPPSATAASCKRTPPVSQSAKRCRRASPAPALTAPAKPGAPSHRQSCSRRPQLDSSRPVLAVQV